MPAYPEYAAARRAVLNAQAADDQAALRTAHVQLAAATAPIAAKVEAAWNANQEALRAAQAAVTVAMNERIQVETEVGNAARARNPAYPVVTDEEKARCEAARQVWLDAKQTLEVAAIAVKSGVTAEQLEVF